VAALHGLDGIQDHPRRAVAVDVDVHVKAGQLRQLDLALDVTRRAGRRRECTALSAAGSCR
jgi:hypothetical protein